MKDTPGHRLQAAIKESRRSQRRVALDIGIAPQSITNAIRRDSVSPSLAQAVGLITGHRWEWILTGQGPKEAAGEAGLRALSPGARRLPVFSVGMVTSWPITPGGSVGAFVYVDTEGAQALDAAAFCLAIDDDSMTDGSRDSVQRGDRVIIDPVVQPQPGDFVVAIVPGQPHALFRRYRERGHDDQGRKRVELAPLNPDFEPHTVTLGSDAANLLGVMVEHRRMRRPILR